jgi:beta-N-acetylhexosaminidase
MGGAREYAAEAGLTFPELCLEALRAGNDMVLLSQTPRLNDAIWARVYAEFQEDAEFRNQIRASVLRILETKIEYLKGPNAVPLEPNPEQVRTLVPDVEGSGFFQDQASRSVTIVRDRGIPFRVDEDARVLLVGKDIDFLQVGRQELPQADVLEIAGGSFYEATSSAVRAFEEQASRYDHVFFCLSDPATREILDRGRELADRITVISILTPIYLRDLPWVERAVAIYGWGVDSYRAGFAALRGEITPEGKLPISLP